MMFSATKSEQKPADMYLQGRFMVGKLYAFILNYAAKLRLATAFFALAASSSYFSTFA